VELVRDGGEICDSGLKRFIRKAKGLRCANCGKDVVDVDSAKERTCDLQLSVRRVRSESETRKVQLKFSRVNVGGIFDAVGDCRFCNAGQARPVFVVHIANFHLRGARARAFKKAALRGEIVLERFVKIHVLAREIRKDSRLKVAAPEAIHHQRMRAGFERGEFPPRIANLRKKTLKIDRLWRGV